MDWLKNLAPAIASALGGPLAGAAVEFLAGKLGASDKTVEGMKQTLAGMTGADLIKLKEMDFEFQKHLSDQGIALQLGQMATNTEEAKSTSIFVSGGRPACIWIGAIALGYASIIEPFLRFASTVWFKYNGPFPVIDTTITMQVLFGLLGLGAMRSIDKKNGVASA